VGEAAAEVFEVGLGIGFGPGSLCHEILREEGGAVLMDVFLHPAEEGKEVAFVEGGGDGVVFYGGFKELG